MNYTDPITTDDEFFNLVKSVANRTASTTDELRITKYLWDDKNWERLKETPHGRFFREVDNVCPDYTLRRMYREEVLGNKKSL